MGNLIPVPILIQIGIALVVMVVYGAVKRKWPMVFDINGPANMMIVVILTTLSTYFAQWADGAQLTPDQLTLYSAGTSLFSMLLHQLKIMQPKPIDPPAAPKP
jgi:hypothetical protein